MTVRPDEMLQIAKELAVRDSGRARQPSLTRAVSTAYYALFHVVLHEIVAQTVSWGFKSERYWQIVRPLYRAVDHGHVKLVLRRAQNDGGSTPELRQFADIFIELQAQRVRADYDPRPDFKRRETLVLIGQASIAIDLLRSLPLDIKRLLVVQLLTKPR